MLGLLVRLLIGVALFYIIKPPVGFKPSIANNGRQWFAWACLIIIGLIHFPQANKELVDVIAIYAVNLTIFGGIAFSIGAVIGWKKSRLLQDLSTASIPSQPTSPFPASITRQSVHSQPSHSAQVANATTQSPPPTSIQTHFAVDEDAVYATVAAELESGNTDKGLWIRIYAECDGDEQKTKIGYIRQRAEKLIAAESARISALEHQRAEETERNDRAKMEPTADSIQAAAVHLPIPNEATVAVTGTDGFQPSTAILIGVSFVLFALLIVGSLSTCSIPTTPPCTHHGQCADGYWCDRGTCKPFPNKPANTESPSSIPTPVIPQESRQLILLFGDKSWVEIRDASKSVLLAGEFTNGERQVAVGKPPFHLWVGRASAVRLFDGDREIDLKQHTSGEVARLIVE